MEVSIAQLTGVDVVHLSLGGLKLASGRHYEKVQFLRSSVVLCKNIEKGYKKTARRGSKHRKNELKSLHTSESEIGLPPQIMSGPILRNATKFV